MMMFRSVNTYLSIRILHFTLIGVITLSANVTPTQLIKYKQLTNKA